MTNCPNCGEDRDILIKMPITVVKTTIAGEATYTREGFKSNGEDDNICFDCLKQESKEFL